MTAAQASQSCLLFPEDRRYPIRMMDDLPLKWIESGPGDAFAGEARLNEFYVFQIGVYASGQDLHDLGVTFSELTGAGGKVISASALRCFNLGGTDYTGRNFAKQVSVPRGWLQPLWIGVDVPKDAAGRYDGTVTIHPANAQPSTLALQLAVSGAILEDRGNGDLWRMARLRWLDSTIGIDDEVVKPYTPVKVDGATVEILGRSVSFAPTGLPGSIKSNGIEVLAAPVELVVTTPDGDVKWACGEPKVLKSAPGAVYMETESASPAVDLVCLWEMECDGYIDYRVTLKAKRAVEIKDIRLALPIRRPVVTYMMGFGCQGGLRPEAWKWNWNMKGNRAVWIGDVEAGLYCALKNEGGPQIGNQVSDALAPTAEKAPGDWANSGKGGVRVSERGTAEVRFVAYTGPLAMAAGSVFSLRFELVVTPFHPLSSDHWKQRYYQFHHNAVPLEEAWDVGATMINVHSGNELNPYISYPFLTVAKLKAYIDKAHGLGMRAKIYYTIGI